jgi:hypothetical protein
MPPWPVTVIALFFTLEKWLRGYTTTQEVVGSRPDEANDFYSISNKNEYQMHKNNVSGE